MNKFKDVLTILFFLTIFGYIFYRIGGKILADYLLKHNAQRIRAVIIDEKNYMGNNPVSNKSSHSYRFYVNGKSYEENSQDSKLQVGDSIDIEYVKSWPYLSRPISSH